MPQIRYMSWNVQDFGQGTATYNRCKGANSVWLAEFIARMAVRSQIDIIGLMELKPGNPQAHLDSVLFALNNRMGVTDWCYDYVKGSVGTQASVVNSPADTTWTSGQISPRQEGYAFFWRNGNANFRMLEAQHPMSEGARRQVGYAPAYMPGNAASLSLMGRDILPRATGNGFPRPATNFNPAAIGIIPFEYAYYPDTSKGVGSWTLFWDKVRRPSYVVLYLQGIGGGDVNRAVPLVLYHTPSYGTLSNMGTFLGGLAAELYALPGIVNDQPTGAFFAPAKSVASGDYNSSISANNYNYRNYYYTYYNAFAANNAGNPAGGENATALYDNTGPIETTIQLYQLNNAHRFNGPPITSGNAANYAFSPIDNMFRRGITLGAAGSYYVWDLVADVMGANANISAGIQSYYAGVNGIAAGANGINANTGPFDANGDDIYSFFDSGVNDWNTFITDLQNGQFTTARGAAEFVRMFVSDHLPLVINFQVV